MVVSFVASALLVGLWLTVGNGALAGAGGSQGKPGAGESVVVGPGETLWEIAAGLDAEGDPRVMVQRIIDLNGLGGAVVQPGQRLRLPAR